LKVGDQVNVRVTHAVVAVLDTNVEKGLPDSAERTGVIRATKDNPNPGGEAYRQVQVQLKITDIDLKNNQLTFQGPAGNKKVLAVEKTGSPGPAERPQGRPERGGDLYRCVASYDPARRLIETGRWSLWRPARRISEVRARS